MKRKFRSMKSVRFRRRTYRGGKRRTLGSRKRFRGRSMTRKVRSTSRTQASTKRLMHPVSVRSHHFPLARNQDRDHFIIQQTFEGRMTWIPTMTTASNNGHDHTDGFLISMTAMSNAFGLGGTGTQGSFNYGLPTVPITPGTRGIVFTANRGVSGRLLEPEGLGTIFSRFRDAYVTHGVYTIDMTQDALPPALATLPNIQAGTVRVAVCGFNSNTAPHTPNAVDGHYIYPSNVTLPSLGYDDDSFAGLRAERDTRVATIGAFGYGGKNRIHIRYPFSVKKYSAPQWYTDVLSRQSGPTESGNPDLVSYQPKILTQLITDQGLQELNFSVQIKMVWYCTAFNRLPVVALA